MTGLRPDGVGAGGAGVHPLRGGPAPLRSALASASGGAGLPPLPQSAALRGAACGGGGAAAGVLPPSPRRAPSQRQSRQ